jgi:hypothetical protein
MKLNLFSIPIYIDDIDCSKINIVSKNFEKTWMSETKSSHNFKNDLDNESLKYLYEKIWDLLKGDFNNNFKIILTNIWENHYIKEDYQEPHCHPQSHFSFIIYKKTNQSKTVFQSPNETTILGYYPKTIFKITNMFSTRFKPSLKSNQIILFPSFLQHFVLKQSDATTIAGNLNIENME